jgi:hypothetical protein
MSSPAPDNRLLLTYRLCLLLPLIWAIGSYATWVAKGCRPFMPFLSDFDIMQPEGTIFSLGATLQGLALMALLIQLHSHQLRRIRRWGLEGRWEMVNHAGLVPGGIATLSCIGLAWAPWNDYTALHRNLALAVFSSGVLWGAASCLLTWRLGQKQVRFQRALRKRVLASIGAALCLGGLLYCMTTVLGAADFDRPAYIARTYDDSIFCHNTFDPLLNVGAVCEWILIGCLLVAIATLREEINPIEPNESPDQD